MTLIAAGVDGLAATGGISIDVLFVAVDREFVLHDESAPSLLLVVLLRVENMLSMLERRALIIVGVIAAAGRRFETVERMSLRGCGVSTVEDGSDFRSGRAGVLELEINS